MKHSYKKVLSHGSICIPAAMRREMGLQGGNPMEVSLSGGTVTVKPYTPRCIFCEATEDVVIFQGKGICPQCARGVVEIIRGGKE